MASGIRLTTEEFIKRGKEIHGDKYDYSKVEYINAHTKVCIICKEHGEFWQKPYCHLKGNGCPKCGGNSKLTIEEFIKRARNVHGNKYDYSKVEFDSILNKVIIICPIHGEFIQRANDHLQGKGCQKCAKKYKITQEEFIQQAKQIHGDKYDYSKVEYKNKTTKVCIICKEHGEFWQTPKLHLRGENCPYCTNHISSKDFFVYKSNIVHNNKYDYSKVEYIHSLKKVCIICPQHGEFWQTPSSHTRGDGCPFCNESRLERDIDNFLKENNIIAERQKHFEWLGRLSLDFYLPQYNIGIECQGEQHFKVIDFFGGEENFNKQVERDKRKYELCKTNGIKLIYYVDNDKFVTFDTFNSMEELLNEIKK